MFNFEAFGQLLHHLFIEVGLIISNDLVGNPVTTCDISFYEVDNHLLGDVGVRRRFDLFGEVVYGNQYKLVSIRSLQAKSYISPTSAKVIVLLVHSTM